MHLTAVNSTMPARILQALVSAEHNTNTGLRASAICVCKKNFVLLLLIAKKRQKSSWIFTLKLFKQVVQGAEIRGILQLSCSTIALVRFAQTATKNVSYILAMQVLQSFDTCSEDGSESYQKQWNNHKIVLIARAKSDAGGGGCSFAIFTLSESASAV